MVGKKCSKYSPKWWFFMVIYLVESVSNTSPLQIQVFNMDILWRYCSLDEVLFCTQNSPPKIGRGEDPNPQGKGFILQSWESKVPPPQSYPLQ